MTRRVQVLFLVALLSLLAAVGLLAAELGGWVALVAYAVVVLALLAAGAARSRADVRAARRAAGHTCDCCSSTVHDEVTVL